MNSTIRGREPEALHKTSSRLRRFAAVLGLMLGAGYTGLGCNSTHSEPDSAENSTGRSRTHSGSPSERRGPSADRIRQSPVPNGRPANGSQRPGEASDSPAPSLLEQGAQEIADKLAGRTPVTTAEQPAEREVPWPREELPHVPAGKLEAAGIRLLSGDHLQLYTDLPSQSGIDELPRVFDAAIPHWCRYFGIQPERTRDWQIAGCLMREPERFRAVGLFPETLPPFLHGYQSGRQFWLYEQPSEYYRRHLLLHEGTHAFMNQFLHGCGPPWYMEGIAELLGTHHWSGGQLELGVFPKQRDSVPLWGRIKIVRDAYQARSALTIDKVLRFGPEAHREVAPYGWCWAACVFLDQHPDFQNDFRKLVQQVQDTSNKFSAVYLVKLSPQTRSLLEQWQLFVARIDYGYDIAREAVIYRQPRSLGEQEPIRVDAARGWQSTGIRLEAGQRYRITASGRFQVDADPDIWWSEPNGVTLRYYQGLPVGQLIAAINDDQQPLHDVTPLLFPQPVGLDAELVPENSGTLFLRINDAPNDLDNNRGEIQVTVRSLAAE